MSEEIDLNVNNLSTTEEAFEVFQSNAMYSEEECLTLPIRECPPPVAVDGASVISDMPIENDVVSSSNIEDQSQLSYCNLEVGSEVNITEEEPDGGDPTLELGNEVNSDANYSQELDNLQEQGSEAIEDVDRDFNMEVEGTIELGTVSSSEACHPAALPPSKRSRSRPRGRGKGRGRSRGRGRPSGRGKKTLPDNSTPTNLDTDVPSDSSLNVSSQSISDNTIESSNNNISLIQSEANGFITSPAQSMDTSTEEIPVVRKRGRKKKAACDSAISPNLDKNTSPKVPRKRGRPRKDSQLNIILENPFPINGETLPANSSCSEMKDLSEVAEDLNEIKNNLSKMDDNLSNIEKFDEDDEDICLSKLKTTFDCDSILPELNDPILKELQEIPSSPLADVELNNENGQSTVAPSEEVPPAEEIKDNDLKVDVTENMIVEEVIENKTIDATNESLLVEDVSKRPKRSNVKKTLKYKNDDDSDEDPFANVELSDDDEPRRGKKSGRYQSDDEYIPGRKGRSSSIDSSDSAVGDTLEELKKQTKKRGRKKTNIDCEMVNLSPKRASKMDITENKNEPWRFSTDTAVEDLCDDNDVGIIQPSVSDESKPIQPSNAWGTSNEFENFLAKKIHGTNLKIKKVSSSNASPSVVTPLEIPVLDPNEAKKRVDCSAQTNKIHTSTTSSQTSGPGTLSMKTNVPLNNTQSENACKFLKSIVKTTSELGQLMTQKSDDFIQKKINTTNVVDTFKMDYCVKKSFLLLKLAKHNLMQMEEDLSSQYEKFLQENQLLSYREQEKKLKPKLKKPDSDSDCEIIEEPVVTKKTGTLKGESKPKFNPKTVFLNKELSIKIAKKPSEDVKKNQNINIKGRHTVWINDSVMVKKVKGSQSFLAQDSRNKKPPDSKVIEKMVSDFFADYNRQKALLICAPFLSIEWITWRPKKYICKYFSVEPDKLTSGNISRTDEIFTNNENNATVSDSGNGPSEKILCEASKLRNPTTLLSICLKNLQEHLYGVESRDVNISHIPENTSKTTVVFTYQPKTLLSSCLESLTKNQQNIKAQSHIKIAAELASQNVQSLKTLCHSRVTKLFCVNKKTKSVYYKRVVIEPLSKIDKSVYYCKSDTEISDVCAENEVKSLLTLCIQVIQDSQKVIPSNRLSDVCIEDTFTFSCPNSLKQIAFEYVKGLLNECYLKTATDWAPSVAVCNIAPVAPHKVKKLADICFDIVSRLYDDDDTYNIESAKAIPIELTINAVNTLSEEAFLNIEETSANDQDNSDFYEDDGDNFYEDESVEPNYHDEEVANQRENESWISQVQLEELKSGFVSEKSKHSSKSTPENENCNITTENYPLIAHIKTEPEFEEPPAICESFIPNIKTESDHYVDQMTIIPESVVTKRECLDNVDPLPVGREPIVRQNSTSFDEENFEAFVRSNKMIHAISHYENGNEETFSQSASRVRRQHEPDSDNENDTSMSLLVPQTFEPLTIESAKGSLLENSSSDSENVGKRNNKRKSNNRRKSKKSEPLKQSKELPSKESKEVQSKDKPLAVNEVAILTRRMRERIRQEEKKVASSESDTETAPPTPRQEKEIKKDTKRLRTYGKNNKPDTGGNKPDTENNKPDTESNTPDTESNKPDTNEIQCNNVDSTELITDVIANKSKSVCSSKEDVKFTGFSAVDQNEMSTYHKYVKYVYDQIIPKVNEETKPKTTEETSNNNEKKIDNGTSDVINPDEPIELLECTPTMPMFDEEIVKLKQKSTKAEAKSPGKKKESKDSEQENTVNDFKAKDENSELFTERNGWKCYPIQCSDTKLYEQVIIPLEKLPESFVQTYFEYQEITVKSKDDVEIDRLTNLQSLNRLNMSSVKKPRIQKDKITVDENEKSIQNDTEQPGSQPYNENYNELSPSEDEDTNYDDDYITPGPDAQENNIAKSSLMNDDEDDDVPLSVRKIKKELDDVTITYKKKRPGPKSKTIDIKQENPESLMLTADKMMNKELTLLHAPVVLNNDTVNNTPAKGPVTRNKPRSGTKNYGKGDRTKSDDSSSEEEKQWVNTKEKLLRRMGKRQETATEDDAKRAKLVTEFIERRNDKPLILNHKPRGRVSRRSRKKLLEKQKQMRVLSYELLGETGTHIGKGNSATYFKGRRNIRKVIDKKSLARSTVIANMEEFERKRRLSMKQKKLEELLGCEEGVNVIVTNDEVCLEYDFEVGQPAVTVHTFFTKVMKAHQYEGVKFMWDACFESLERVQSGHPGGGCILAHCMGLGKTLQVLALLHTVLTHPRVGMHRVLVCCPLSTVLNWVDEIHKWIGPVTDQIKVFELSKLKKTYERAYQLEDWYSGGGIFIIGYELFRSLTTLDAELDDIRQTIIDKIRTALLDPGPDIIVCDEGHLLKNDCSVLAVAMSRVATRRRIVLTGTPMQNNLREYYCMVNFVKPNLLGTYAEFSNRFENPIMNGQHRDSQVEDIRLMKARTHILHKVLEGCLQRQEASVLYPYLPKKHEYTVFITLTKWQCELYKHYLNVYANKKKQGILKDFHTLQKIWSHPLVLHNFNMKSRDEKIKLKAEKLEDDLACEDLTATEDIKPSSTEVWWLQYLEGGDMLERLESSNKFMAVFRILEESVALDDKVLIFSTSLITMDALEYFLKKIKNWSLGQEYYRLDGSVPPEVRQKWCREFNADHNYKTKLFLISTRAGSLGLNMTAANRVIILDTSWNPAHDIQSIFRVYRFGQRKDCYIYRLVALGTMEQKIYERAVTKQAVSCRVVDEQQIDRHYNMAELTELYRFDETGVGVAGGVAVGVQDVVLLRVARDAALHAVHEHDSLLRGSEPALPEAERAAAWHQFQQETQHKQMEADKTPKKEKKVAKRSLSIEKPMFPSITTEVKQEPGVEGATLPSPAEPRPKRGKKIINCCIPIHSSPQPSTSRQPDDFLVDKSQETDMVAKISQILVSHEFNSRNSARDLSKLIATVQQAVASGDLSRLPPGDEAAASIAQILLRKESPAPTQPMPLLTDVRNPTQQIEQPRTFRKQREQTEDLTFSDTNTETITGDLNVKSKRRAALSAQKKIDSIADDIVIDLNDDDWRNDDDFAVKPTRNPEPQPTKYKPGPKSKRKPDKPAEKPAAAAPVANPPVEARQLVEAIQQTIDLEESILLSDDEIVPEARPAPAQVKREPSTDKDSEEKYPLHPSLLTNQNFVKIVAHTYLVGNPMLDEDAATLAARYSTSKALHEMEATGRCIDSGPIYDIAVKVLGMDILEKLHNSGNAANTPSQSQQKALSETERMLSDAAPEPKPLGRLKAKVTSELMPKERKPKIANLGLVKLTPVTPVIAAPVVVPVGLIKRAMPAGSLPGAVGEECILPDDEDMRAPSPAPAPPPLVALPRLAPAPAPQPRDDRLRTNVKLPIAPENTPVIKVVGNRFIAVGPGAQPSAPAPPAPAPPAPSATICLDSDEEDAPPAPAPTPSVVPVTLTASSGVRLELSTPRETPLRARPAPPAPAAPAPAQPPRNRAVEAAGAERGRATPPRPAPDPKPEAPKPKSSTVCKPGDIIRISRTGQVEVLNKVDAVPDFISRAGKVCAGPGPAAAPAASAAAPGAPPGPRKPAEQKSFLVEKEQPVRVTSGSSSSSRSASPVDPLSILKDVVHIPADRYQPTTGKAPRAGSSKPPPEPPKPQGPKKPAEKTGSLFHRLNTLKPKESPQKPVNTAKGSPANISKNKQQAPANTTPRIIVDSVDLTEVAPPAPPPRSKSDKSIKNSLISKTPTTTKPSKRMESVATVVGTSKNIILTGSGKTNKVTVGTAPSSSSKGSAVRVTNMETLAPASAKPRVDKKRPAIKLEPEASKRKKTEPMTLKDFNLDDIDDIIELE